MYTADAVVEGGRQGHGRTSDGRVDLDLDIPAEMGGDGGPGTNPEQLFAVGFAACFLSSLQRVAAGRHLNVSGAQIKSRVQLGPLQDGGFALAVTLDLYAPSLEQAAAVQLMTLAHEQCPYSRATRDNIEVVLAVSSIPIP
jgi:Ohr subfamily peroxiredoxin